MKQIIILSWMVEHQWCVYKDDCIRYNLCWIHIQTLFYAQACYHNYNLITKYVLKCHEVGPRFMESSLGKNTKANQLKNRIVILKWKMIWDFLYRVSLKGQGTAWGFEGIKTPLRILKYFKNKWGRWGLFSLRTLTENTKNIILYKKRTTFW